VRIDALWTLHQLHELRETNLIHAVDDAHPGVQKNALRVVTERGVILSTNLEKAVVKQVKDTDDRVKLNALFALQQGGLAKETRQSVLRHFSEQKDLWAKSAYLGIAMTSPMDFIKEALATDKGEHLKDLVSTLCDHLVETRSLSNAVYIVQRLARDGKKAGPSLLQAAIFDSFTRADSEFVPAWTPELEKAFKTLLDAESATVRYNSLALVNRWDKKNALAGQAATAKKELLEDLKYLEKDDARMRVISAVMSIPSIHPDIIPILEKVLDTNFSAAVQNHLVKEFARSPEKAVAPALIRHFSKLNPEGRQLAVNTLLKREEWVSTLIDAIADKGIGLRDLGIVAVNRLRNYPEPALARHAAEVIEPIQGPFEKDKLALIAKLRPVLGERADLKNGGEMFRNNCGICHKFGEKDKDREKAKELGPELNGIGVYGPAMLLTHILDPNRVVETNFIAYNVSTKKQGNYYGIIVSETKDSLKIRNFEGETEIRAADIVLKNSTRVSFMPEGMERLGEKNIRDIIAYLVEKAPKAYRPLDLATAFTADSRKTLFAEQGGSPSLEFKKFGLISIDHVPFNIANPDSLAEGRNLIVLRGGKGFAKTLPQRAEIPVETAAKKIHVLGGIAGWGYASGRGGKTNDPLVRAQIVYADKKSEELVFKNGYEFADYVKRIDVPGSRYVPDLLAEGQVRLFSFAPKRTNEISKIILESVDGAAAPTFVAMTAQILDR
jgi:putative heme-binding domain-containing protein